MNIIDLMVKETFQSKTVDDQDSCVLTIFGKYDENLKSFLITISDKYISIPDNWSFARELKKRNQVEIGKSNYPFVEIVSEVLKKNVEKILFNKSGNIIEAKLFYTQSKELQFVKRAA